MRALLIIIIGLMVASILGILVIKLFVTGKNQDSQVAQKTIEQPEPKP
jgi:flagellar basal body-associated protein FliL